MELAIFCASVGATILIIPSSTWHDITKFEWGLHKNGKMLSYVEWQNYRAERVLHYWDELGVKWFVWLHVALFAAVIIYVIAKSL